MIKVQPKTRAESRFDLTSCWCSRYWKLLNERVRRLGDRNFFTRRIKYVPKAGRIISFWPAYISSRCCKWWGKITSNNKTRLFTTDNELLLADETYVSYPRSRYSLNEGVILKPKDCPSFCRIWSSLIYSNLWDTNEKNMVHQKIILKNIITRAAKIIQCYSM